MRLIHFLAEGLLALSGANAFAEDPLRITVAEGIESATPIAVIPFANENAGLPPETDASDVVRMDLNRSGQFRSLPKGDVVEFPTRGSDIKFPTWNMLKQAYIVVGRISDADGGALRVEFELYDVAKQERMLGLAITGQRSDLRQLLCAM